MVSFINIFLSVSTLLALLAAAILTWVNKDQLYSNRKLAFVLLILGLNNLNTLLIYSKWLLLFPYLHKLALPITLLIAPLSWMYIKSILWGELKSSKKDWLIYIPAFLCFIDLLPYYSMSIIQKKAYIENFFKYPYLQAQFREGILPPYIFAFLRVIWSSFFVILNFKLIKQFRKINSSPLLVNNDALLKWLSLFNWLLTGLLIAALINAIIAPIFKTNLAYVDLVAGISVFIICLRLFIQPRLLYGIFNPIDGYDSTKLHLHPIILNATTEEIVAAENNETAILLKKQEPQLVISQADFIRYKKTIETFFDNNSPFLQKDYTLEKLVIDTNIPRHAISAFVNREYGMGFREFLNRYRVNYFIENLNNPNWENLTLEAIASECGYTARSTFISNFKQVTGQTPSEYMKNLTR